MEKTQKSSGRLRLDITRNYSRRILCDCALFEVRSCLKADLIDVLSEKGLTKNTLNVDDKQYFVSPFVVVAKSYIGRCIIT